MHLHDLVRTVADATGVARATVERILRSTLAHVTRALERGESVALVGFGNFSVRRRAGRKVPNPRRLSQTVNVPPTNVAHFTAGTALKRAVRSTLLGAAPAARGGRPTRSFPRADRVLPAPERDEPRPP